MSSLSPIARATDPTGSMESGWPLLAQLTARASRAPSARLGRLMKAIVLRLALAWLALAVSWALLRVAAQQAGTRSRR